jgi:hypothetical protein
MLDSTVALTTDSVIPAEAFYNRAVMNVNTRYVRNVDDRHVTNYTSGRTSYNGRPRGLSVRPTASEQVALRQRRMQAVPAQVQREREAATNRAQFASENRYRPAVAAAESRPMKGRSEDPPREALPANVRPEERERPPIERACQGAGGSAGCSGA